MIVADPRHSVFYFRGRVQNEAMCVLCCTSVYSNTRRVQEGYYLRNGCVFYRYDSFTYAHIQGQSIHICKICNQPHCYAQFNRVFLLLESKHHPVQGGRDRLHQSDAVANFYQFYRISVMSEEHLTKKLCVEFYIYSHMEQTDTHFVITKCVFLLLHSYYI